MHSRKCRIDSRNWTIWFQVGMLGDATDDTQKSVPPFRRSPPRRLTSGSPPATCRSPGVAGFSSRKIGKLRSRVASAAHRFRAVAKSVIIATVLKTRRTSTVWVGAILIGLIALQQSPFIVRGDYSRRIIWESVSPDHRYRVEVRRQATFPAFLDPAGFAYFAIIDTKTGRLGARTVTPLRRVFAWSQPKVEWTTKDVEVFDFDRRQASRVRLLLAP